MKRKLFIGSSSKGITLAHQVKDILNSACGDWLECIIWNEGKVFAYNKSYLDNLINASRRYDYGVLIATSDDWAIIRKLILKAPRDNVVFEMGLFLGSLGLTRAFLLADKKTHLPSDYNGISIPKFTSNKITASDLKGMIQQLNDTKKSYVLKSIPSAALALGYFDNFILPFAKNCQVDNFHMDVLIPSNIEDLRAIVKFHKSNFPSIEMSVFNDNSRPIINFLKNDHQKFWDIPSTLTTLYKLIGYMVHSNEIGLNPEKKEWVEYELRNFIGSLEVLISENSYCKDRVTVKWLSNQ